MNTITKKMTQAQIEQLYKRLSKNILKESKPAYTYYQIKVSECTITAYTSGKVVFQGKDLAWLLSEESSIKTITSNTYPQAGSDEVGTGDYFGPVVVCACIVEEKYVKELESLGITDSKQITDEKIRELAPKIKEWCPHSILVLQNAKYNQIHQLHNMVDIKCRLHNQAYVNLVNKGYELPKNIIIDQFVQEKSYYKYLQNEKEVIKGITFETKAESKYLAVACASVLARNAFLEAWDLMEEKYEFEFIKGASNKVDICGKSFIEKYGMEKLPLVAKIHFKNTEKIQEL